MSIIEKVTKIQQLNSQVEELKSELTYDVLIAEIQRLSEENSELNKRLSEKKVDELEKNLKCTTRANEKMANHIRMLNDKIVNYERKLSLIDTSIRFSESCYGYPNCKPEVLSTSIEKVRMILGKCRISNDAYVELKKSLSHLVNEMKDRSDRIRALQNVLNKDDEDDKRDHTQTVYSWVRGVDAEGEVGKDGVVRVQLTKKPARDEDDEDDDEHFVEL
jgi:regulator of replication initiation timing